METLTRATLFIFSWLILFFTGIAVTNAHEDTSIFYDNFTGIIFFCTSVLLLIWLYFSHQDVSAEKNLKETLYIITVVSIFTSLASFLGFC